MGAKVSYDFEPDDTDEARNRGPVGKPVSPAVAAALERGRGGGQRRSKSDGPDESYVEVKERIQWFYATYPEGALVTEKISIIEADFARGKQAVLVESAAYRTPDDPHPGRGSSWMVIPGHTPYTNGSEVENAETSSWGRSIAAIGGLVDRGIASAQEIRSKAGDELEQPSRVSGPAAALAQAAANLAGASPVTPAPVNGADTAPAAPEEATVQESTAVEPAHEPVTGPVEVLTAPEANEATETAAEPEAAPEPVSKPKGQGKAKKEAPEAKEADPPPAQSGLTYDEFKNLAREKFIPNGHIQAVARELMEAKSLRQVGGVKDMTDEERLVLLLAALAKMDDEK
jgi:hypothetical protein